MILPELLPVAIDLPSHAGSPNRREFTAFEISATSGGWGLIPWFLGYPTA